MAYKILICDLSAYHRRPRAMHLKIASIVLSLRQITAKKH